MNAPRAFLAGVVGGAVMSALMFLGRAGLGLDVDLEMLMGTVFLERGAAAWLLGLGMHLMMSGLIGVGYALAFERVTQKASAGIGAAFSVVHMLVAGPVMGGVVPLVHRLVPEQMPGPGYFLAHHGAAGVATFVVLHLVFGAVVGALYAGHVGRRA